MASNKKNMEMNQMLLLCMMLATNAHAKAQILTI